MAIDFQRLEKDLAREFRQYHVAAQVRRVGGVFVGVLVAQLATGWHAWTWKGLIALAAAAGYGTLRQVFPTVPWKVFLGHVQAARAVESASAAAVSETVPIATSERTYTPVTKSATAPQTTGERPDPAPPEKN